KISNAAAAFSDILRYSYLLLSHSFNGTMFRGRCLLAKPFGAGVLAFRPHAPFKAYLSIDTSHLAALQSQRALCPNHPALAMDFPAPRQGIEAAESILESTPTVRG
ncbi:MAG: hypothetical protein VW738_13335, partial [Pseudomonadales bacterium]